MQNRTEVVANATNRADCQICRNMMAITTAPTRSVGSTGTLRVDTRAKAEAPGRPLSRDIAKIMFTAPT
jgi:hypothetical protein